MPGTVTSSTDSSSSNTSQAPLLGRVAFVAASSKGIGKAIAAELRRRGAHIVVSSRNEENLRGVVAELQKIETPAQIAYTVVDVENEDSVRRGIEFVVQKFKKLDILVSNSGGFPHKAVLDCGSADWESAITSKFRSLFWLASCAVPFMKRVGAGSIINVSSAYAKEPHDGYQLANSVRQLAAGYLKSLADECAPFGVRVNQLLCGYINTERLASYFADHSSPQGTSKPGPQVAVLSKIPMGRFGEPSEVAQVAAFLASDESSYVTGQSLVCDGGLLRGVF